MNTNSNSTTVVDNTPYVLGHDGSKPVFRESAVTALVRDAVGISIWTRRTAQPIVLRFAQLSDAVRAEAMGYGMEVRITRAAALMRDTKSGKPALPSDKHAAMKRLADHYASGTDSWTMAGGGGGGLSADTRALIEALAKAFDIEASVAEEQVREMDSAQRDALRVDEEVKPYLDEVYAQRAKSAGADIAGLKAKLKGGL